MIKFWCSGNLLLLNPIPHMAILSSSSWAASKKYDVKNMDKWGTII